MEEINGFFKKPLKLRFVSLKLHEPLIKPRVSTFSELMGGTSFELNVPENNFEQFDEDLLWDGTEEDLLDRYANPCSTTFAEQQKKMDLVSEGLYKKVLKSSDPDAKAVDVCRQRVIYHRNMYIEDESNPFDSTHLIGKAEEMCLPLDKQTVYLEGFVEALETMKEGEQSLFLISYKKMSTIPQ
jgi:hypothetical protein